MTRKSKALCETIRKAFAGVKLGNGIGLREAQGIDDAKDAASCAQFRYNDEKEDWARIPASELNHCNSSLSFFDAEGMRFHLPAYLIADLQGTYKFGMAFCFTVRGYDERFELLSAAQRQAVRAFLLYIRDDPNYRLQRSDIRRALEEQWSDAAAI